MTSTKIVSSKSRGVKLQALENYLKELYPVTTCFLHYERDYELLFAVMLSAQATDKSVNEATAKMFKRYRSLEDYATAELSDLIKYIKTVGLANSKAPRLIACAKILLEEYGGVVPMNRELLMQLPGVGYKTATVVLGELTGYHSIPVDTHIFRIISRLKIYSNKKLSADEMSKRLDKDYLGQDHMNFHRQIILFGRNICTARMPNCEICKLLGNLCPGYNPKLKG